MTDHDQILKDIGARIREARTAQRRSQQAFAKMVSTSQSHISEIECGKAGDLGIKVLCRLADALGTTAAHLVGGDPLVAEATEQAATDETPPQVEVILAIPNHSITLKGPGSNRDVIADAVWALGEATAMVRDTGARIGQHL